MSVPIEEYCAETKNTENVERSQISANLSQPTTAYVDYRTVPKHKFLEEWHKGTGGFAGLTTGTDEKGDANRSYVHVKPTERFYQNRVAQGQYINESDPYISSLIDPVFSADVSYNTTSKSFSEFVKMANRNGTPLNDVKKIAGKSATLHDSCFLLMDSAPETERVFLSYKTASDVCSITKNKYDGTLESISFFTDCNPQNGLDRRYMYEAGRVMLQEVIHASNDLWQTIEIIPTGVSELNVYTMFYTPTPEGEYISKNPKQYGIACLAANLYNSDVRVTWIETVQGHGTLVVTGVREIKGVPDSTSNGIVLYNSEGGTADAKYIHLESSILDSNLSSLEKKRATLQWLMGTRGVDLVPKSTAESGISKAFDYIATNDTLLAAVDMYQSADEWIVKMFKLFTSDVSKFEVEVSYASDFFPKTSLTVDELLLVAEYASNKGLEEMNKQIARNLVTLIAQGQSHERKQELMDEVDSTRFLGTSMNDSVVQ